MKSIAIIYHSRQGHTQFIAQQIQIGAAKIENMDIDLFTAEQLMSHPELLAQYDGLIWGTPTYLGGVSGTLKQLMDATGPLWKKQSFKGKLQLDLPSHHSPLVISNQPLFHFSPSVCNTV